MTFNSYFGFWTYLVWFLHKLLIEIMVDMSSDADGIADFLSCSANLERKNSQLFKNLSEKIVCFSVKPPFIKDYRW